MKLPENSFEHIFEMEQLSRKFYTFNNKTCDNYAVFMPDTKKQRTD